MLLFYMILLISLKVFVVTKDCLYKRKINDLLKVISSKEDLLYLNFRDYMSVIIEVLKRNGYKIKSTRDCGIDGSGLMLNSIQFAEIWKHGLNQIIDVELAMNLAKCMQKNSVYRGMLITLGDFKPCTKAFCHRNVIECINGDQLLNMCKAVQKTKAILQPAK